MLHKNYAILQNAKIRLPRFRPHHPDTLDLIPRISALPVYKVKFFRPALHGTYRPMSPDVLVGHNRSASNSAKKVTRDSLKSPCNRGRHLASNKFLKDIAF
jgi:hypothetical protein